MTDNLPPLPPGFTLDSGGAPPLPPGFTLDQPEAKKTTPLLQSVPHQGFSTQVGRALAGDTARVPVQTNMQQGADILKGSVIGALSGVPGTPGDIEALGRLALSPMGVSQQTLIPTGTDVGNAVFGQPANATEESARGVGGFASPFVGKMLMKGVGKVAGALAKPLLGVTTGVGETPIAEAYKAGQAGGQASRAFLDAMRGDTPATDVVQKAKDAVSQLRQERSAAYQAGIGSTIKGDPTVLNFTPVDQAIRNVAGIGVYKGKVLSQGAEKVWSRIENVVDDWRQSNPADFHTAEGLDALKQKIGNLGYEEDLQSLTKPGSPGKIILDNVYNAVKGQIVQQAPGYAKVMKDYMAASDEIRNIEGAMSLGNKANVDTSLRKLQSIMRNNVNTNYGARSAMGETLDAKAGGTLMPELAGQAMSAKMPRGLGQLVASGEMLSAPIAALTGNPAVAAGMVPLLAASSPRLVGEAAHALGRLGQPLQKAAVGTIGAANIGAAIDPFILQLLGSQGVPPLLMTQPARTP